MKKHLYLINISGCDDTTSFTMELSEEGVRLIEELSFLSRQASSYKCQPVLTLEKEGPSKESIKEILMRRDSLSSESADELIAQAVRDIAVYYKEKDFVDINQVCTEFLGLGLEYLPELVKLAIGDDE